MRKILLKQNRHTDRDSRRHYEVTSRDIPNLSDRRSNARSRSSNIVARYQSFNKEKGEIRYNVTSQTKAGKSYTVSFRFKNWHPDMNHLDDEIQHSMKGDIEIDCTCPAFEFQGYKYLATLKGGSIEAEKRPPDKTNRDRHGFACKHILKAIDSFNQDFDKFRSEGKGMIRKRNLRVQHKYEGRTSLSVGEKLYNKVTKNLDGFTQRVQKSFLSLCKKENLDASKTYFVVRKDVGLEDDRLAIVVYLYEGDKRNHHEDEYIYWDCFSFQEDGAHYEGRHKFFVGDTESDLISAIADCFTNAFSKICASDDHQYPDETYLDDIDDEDFYGYDYDEKRSRPKHRRRFEGMNLGKELYRDIANDINDFIERAQARFEDVCQHDYGCNGYDARVDILDGLQSDEGYWVIDVSLCVDNDDHSVCSSIVDRSYEFRPDGIYDDAGFVGDTEDELLDNIAVTFAEDYSDFQYDSMNGYR